MLDFEEFLEKVGVRISEDRSTDTEIFGWCPGHKRRVGHVDRSPSWSINRETGEHNCFSCGYKGSLLGLVMDVSGLDPFTASGMIRSWGVDLGDLDSVMMRSRTKTIEIEIDIQPESILEGFVPPPRLERLERGLTASACAHYGVRWDTTHGGWILPIRLPDGDLVGYQIKRGSYVRNRPKDKVKKGETLFGIDVFPGGTAVVVESPLDAVRLESVGVEGGLALMGVHATTTQMELLTEYADDVILALDNDDEGKTATDRLIVKWAGRITMKVFNYGDVDAKDPGDCSRSEIEWGIANAVPATAWSRS